MFKKPALDHTVVANFRPNSNICYLYKILEKVVYNQLMAFLKRQKRFRDFSPVLNHYTALSQDFPQFLMTFLATDSGDAVIFMLLDFTVVFDTVDHQNFSFGAVGGR